METDIALLGVLPAVLVALAVLGLVVQPWRTTPLAFGAAALASALAFALAFALGHTLLVGFAFPPEKPVEWWPYAALGGIAVTAGDLALGRRLAAGLALRLALAGALAWVVVARLAGYFEWSHADLARITASFAVPIAVLGLMLERRAAGGAEPHATGTPATRPHADLAGIWLPSLAAFAYAFFVWAPSSGTLSATVACAAGAVLLAAALAFPRRVDPSGPIACATLLFAVVVPMARYSSEIPWPSLGPLLASPLAGLLPLGRSRQARIARWLLALGLAATGAWFARQSSLSGESLYGY